MSNLEKYILENKSRFDEEPEAGHFERLQQKINRKSGRIAALSWSISIAASIMLFLITGIIWQQTKKQGDSIIICENAIDMKSCYINKMNAVADRIGLLSKNLDSWDRQQVMTDVQNIISSVHSDFDSEIPKELPERETRLILSDYYRQNLESLESIADRLKNEL